ncbi:hypothetical protein [Butyricicoccus pullicaecorum]|uniref:DUF4376 domain-containing protein n=1 Tax=Butyricicoccus pullicaecorum 1.2 TaxID=1203606 RepID=R8W488_9FIRM|nr:hypothetical protein [Butyricicoccus pullicaecorum]EOQ37937.1 hypothetical protein HMPREF1526_00965 [Butyricicoccus pullicaecorum 1.2]SKA60701.1 hypothetical protein SAMN02745978_01945 [Butyricicoccus pullicaecorum DSM 23266]
MIYAKIVDSVCINAAVFDDEATAIDFGYPVLLPDGYGIGDLYDGENWSHAPAPEPEPVDLAVVQQARQTENKAALAEWLAAHPLLWTDGKLYGVTEEDQQEMALNLMQYQVAVQAGQPAVLEWHAQKESCRTFEQQEYVSLSLAIADYVYPYLRYQESVKEAIYQAQTAEEVANVKIDYASVGS